MAGAEWLKIIANENDNCIPEPPRGFSLDVLARQYVAIAAEIGVIEKRIHAWHRSGAPKAGSSRRSPALARSSPQLWWRK